jgi:hypothetical protein
MTSISSLEVGGGVVLQRNTPQHYENLKHFFNKEEVKRFPSEIHIVESSQQVANALNRAQQLGDSVGVRSGGHLPSKPSLIQDGILIDVLRLNRQVVYDEKTQQVAFGPAVRVFEAWEATNTVGRFFPFGHAPDVALGGFCLAGGQGFYMKGWGATVTRLWSRTIPAKTLYGRSFVFNVGERFEDLMTFAFDKNDAMPNLFNECAVCTMHSELLLTDSADDYVPESSPLLLMINVSAYANTLIEATNMLDVWDDVPESLERCLIKAELTTETDWKEFFQL